jgi:methyltransferase (TIGR00027 family)
VHFLLDDPPAILEDRLAVRLLGPGVARAIQEDSDRFRTPASYALRCDVLVRSRYAEDQLAEAVRRGVRQYAILGAGLDTFAYRQAAWAGELRIVEVDHEASQLDKRARLSRAGIGQPTNLRFAAADLETDALAPAHQGAGLDTAKPTFVTCIGVLIYLSVASGDAISDMAGRLAAGSEFVFTFSRPDASTAGSLLPGSAAGHMADIGEPWRTRWEPEALAARLEAAGFRSTSFLYAEDVAERYLQGRHDGLRAPSRVVLGDAMV